jgi:Holliday junction resolvase RusA-like endonuclease
MGAVRMTQRGKFLKPNAQRYLNYKQAVGYQLRQQYPEPTEYAVAVKARFVLPMPKSWSKKKRAEMAGAYCPVKPDGDNLVKGLFDAANGIVWKDDNLVVRCEYEKIYGETGRIELEVQEVF